MDVKPGGFSEVGLSTRDIDAWIEFLTQVGGYEEIWRGDAPAGSKTLWQVPADRRVQECLVGCPGEKTGYIRLFQFHDTEQEEIRRGANVWDSGGIFDVDIRVPEVLPLVSQLEQHGFNGISPPVDWQFGPFKVREWIATGPDSVSVAIMQRLAPPLEGWDFPAVFGRMFNSSQVVADLDRAIGFYHQLGFAEVMRHSGPMPGKGGEMLGLPSATAHLVPVHLVILQPFGVMEGSVELVWIEGMDGQDVSARSWPCNLGFNLVRFPVDDLTAYASRIRAAGISIVGGRTIPSRLEPFGGTEVMAVQTPDGVWLEFYQAITR